MKMLPSIKIEISKKAKKTAKNDQKCKKNWINHEKKKCKKVIKKMRENACFLKF